MGITEYQIRRQHIDSQLAKAGWGGTDCVVISEYFMSNNHEVRDQAEYNAKHKRQENDAAQSKSFDVVLPRSFWNELSSPMFGFTYIVKLSGAFLSVFTYKTNDLS